MRKMILATAAALASLILMSNIASNVAMTRPAHAQDNVAQAWLITATISDKDGAVLDVMYFRENDPTMRFADKATCDAFLDSSDRVKSANDGLRAQVAAGAAGEGATVAFSCTVAPRE